MIGSLSRKVAALVAALAAASALWVGVVEAGVILHEQEIVSQKDIKAQKEHRSKPLERVFEIEGSKEKITAKLAVHDIVIDLATNHTLFIHPDQKDYFLADFPPKGATALWMVLPLVTPPVINYKLTGKSSTVSGYSCQEYSGEGDFYKARYSVKACYSTTAPGADVYSAFVKKAASQLRSGAAPDSVLPNGVPLSMRITQKGLKLSPDYGKFKKENKKPLAPTPTPAPKDWIELQTRDITVTSIEVTKDPLPDSHFIPSGFQAKRPANIGF